jgi:Secretion system C-terminal sorting domain
MKKFYFLCSIFLSASFVTNAQNTVTVDAGAAIVGYANVFETPANGEAFVFGEAWGVPDLKTVLDATANTITLQPNFSAWDESDPFWVDGGVGNKFFEGNTYVEDNSLVGSELTFTGGVLSNDLDSEYEAMAFIKVFNADFSVLKIETAPLIAGSNFSITYTDVEPEDTTVQYGFFVYGRNANPEDEAALGSIVVSDMVLGVDEFDASAINTYPNPATDVFNINSQEVITNITVFNVLGQNVLQNTPETTDIALNISGLNAGVYVAQISTATGTKTTKFVKK